MYGFIVPELQKGVIIGEWGGSMQGMSIGSRHSIDASLETEGEEESIYSRTRMRYCLHIFPPFLPSLFSL